MRSGFRGNDVDPERPRRRITNKWLARAAGIATLVALGVVAAEKAHVELSQTWPRTNLGTGAGEVAFVPDGICAGCHESQAEAWSTSHHFHAMAEAAPDTILADFEDRSFEHDGSSSRFYRDGERYFVETVGPEGDVDDFEVLYTFGVEPLQQYLVGMPNGHLQGLTVAWDSQAERWFDLYPGQTLAPGDPLHWTGRLNNWNGRCAECHSTDLRTNFDLESRSFQTEWSAINVGCQACHGPGAAHLAWAQDGVTPETSFSDVGLVVDHAELGPAGQVEICARCHARRHRITVNDVHGNPFVDDFVPALLREDLYHADGQILDEVFVYGSFAQSKMYQAGVTCTDCHNPHSGELLADGNGICTQCHNTEPPARFPGLTAADYDAVSHHHHEPGTSGALCVDCHMPAQTYMVVDPRRDHSFRIPRPDLSVALGTPNACTGCHIAKADAWAAAEVAAWFGLSDDLSPHYGMAIAAGRAGDADGAAALSDLAQDSTAPGIVRATALDLIPQYGVAGGEAIVAGLQDPDPLVRAAAIRGFSLASPEQRVPFLFPLLTDPVRAVRIEAARQLAPIPTEVMEPALLEPFEAALQEYIAAQMASAETPEAHLNLGGLHEEQGLPDLALAEYQTAITLAPDFMPARINLANLYNSLGQNDLAEAALRDAIASDPNYGDTYYSLGLLLAEMGRLEEAAATLKIAAQRMPDRARVHYNLGVARQQLGQVEEAEQAYRTAELLDPENRDTLEALAIFFAQQERWDEAIRYAEELVRLDPTSGDARQLLLQMQLDSDQ